MLTNLSVSVVIKIQRNPDNTLAEKNKRSHRVVVRDTLCVFVIISLPLEDSRKRRRV